ncbi:MAG TPA: hypothetical protein VME24_05960 [Alphaproteobacteria bacterium]|nr:hypothetical protein [Alphaproteobacteria bacterium]
MANGKPGDHPLTDILIHKLEVYGAEADELIRKIDSLGGRRELEEWWERCLRTATTGSSQDSTLVLAKARERYGELLSKARESSWGT